MIWICRSVSKTLLPKVCRVHAADGLGNRIHHVTDTQVLFRAHDDRPLGGFQVQEVHEVAARQVLDW